MKTRADILTTLQGLSNADRSWIIGRLSARAKQKLLGPAPEAAAHQQPIVASQASTHEASDLLARVEAASLARVLKHEPAWVTAALLCTREGSHSEALLESLPALLRADVERIRSTGIAITPHLAETLARAVAARLDGGNRERPPSMFDALVERLGASRSKKRLSMHL